MSTENIIKWSIGIIGVFILPPGIDFITGIILFIASSVSNEAKVATTFKLYGSYFILAGICAYITILL